MGCVEANIATEAFEEVQAVAGMYVCMYVYVCACVCV
jgi:hypothetical protein